MNQVIRHDSLDIYSYLGAIPAQVNCGKMPEKDMYSWHNVGSRRNIYLIMPYIGVIAIIGAI